MSQKSCGPLRQRFWFGLEHKSGSRVILEKAKRELNAMKTKLSADTVFNFFVTAYHIMDYVKNLAGVSKPAIDAMYADPDFDTCKFICNRGKHLVVTRGPKDVNVRMEGGSGLGFGPISGGPISSTPE